MWEHMELLSGGCGGKKLHIAATRSAVVCLEAGFVVCSPPAGGNKLVEGWLHEAGVLLYDACHIPSTTGHIPLNSPGRRTSSSGGSGSRSSRKHAKLVSAPGSSARGHLRTSMCITLRAQRTGAC